jgi:hypothetical protein
MDFRRLVRRPPAFEADDRLIIGSARRHPQDVANWQNALPAGRSVAGLLMPVVANSV